MENTNNWWRIQLPPPFSFVGDDIEKHCVIRGHYILKTVLADIGGTHVRFALAGDGALIHPLKLKAADFTGFQDAMEQYFEDIGEKAENVMAATAAWPNEHGVYKFSNATGWDFDPQKLRNSGYRVDYIYNDFEAASYGALSPNVEQIAQLKDGRKGRDYPRVVLGPGTGLGLGFALPQGDHQWRVQPTFGARMMVSAHTDEQHEIVKAALQILGEDKIVEFEHLASGRGMILLHEAVCAVNNLPHFGQRAEHILEKTDVESVQTTLRLFHEFLGLFIQSATLFTHGYGGVYMTGGMMDRLIEKNLFASDVIIHFMTLPLAEYIDHVMKGTPLFHVSDPYLALKGLMEVYSYGESLSDD